MKVAMVMVVILTGLYLSGCSENSEGVWALKLKCSCFPAYTYPDVVQNFAKGARDRGVEVLLPQLMQLLIWWFHRRLYYRSGSPVFY